MLQWPRVGARRATRSVSACGGTRENPDVPVDHLEPTVAIRSGERYEIQRVAGAHGYALLDGSGAVALVMEDLAGPVFTLGTSWQWSVSRHRLRWAFDILSGESQREVLRVAPGAGLVAYRMSAERRTICTLRQNALTHRWTLRRRAETLARIVVQPAFYSPQATDRSAGRLEVGSALASSVLWPASIVAALLCIRGEEGYTRIGESVIRGE